MSFLSFFRKNNEKDSASIAKERLQIIVAKDLNSNPILNIIEEDVIDAIKKYVKIDPLKVETNVEEEIDILHVNAELEDDKESVEKSSLLDLFFSKKKKSASIAKERLQIIIARDSGAPEFSEQLEKDIKAIVMKHIKNNPESINISFEQDEHGIDFLELNISLPESINNI